MLGSLEGLVLLWSGRSRCKGSAEEVVSELEKKIVGFKKVWKKYSDFESADPTLDDLIMERFHEHGGLKLPGKMMEDFLDGKLSPIDIGVFLYDTHIPKGIEDESAFGVKKSDLMHISHGIRVGMIFPQMKCSKQLEVVHTTVELSFTDLYSINYPVRIIYDNQHLDYCLKIEKENELKIFACCSLAGSPQYIHTTMEQTIEIDIIQKDFPRIADLSSFEDAIFILSVVYLLKNGLNGKIWERELNGLIKHHLAIKRGEDYSKPPITIRSCTLFTYYQSIYSHHLSLLRYLHIPNQLYLNLNGRVFHHYLAQEISAFSHDPEFINIKELIISFIPPFPIQYSPAPIVCRYWKTPGGCRYGDDCYFDHT